VTNSSQTEALTPSPLEAAEATPARSRSRHRVPLWRYPATYLLIGINIAVFLVMFPFGPVMGLVHQHAWSSILTAPFDVDTLVRFGASASPLIQAGQWWRLVTGAFVHVTILHIALNLWCLWNLGIFGEPLLGKRGLVAVYLLTGTTGMMFSYAWSIASGQIALVAGASGAVFGIAGILIILLSTASCRCRGKSCAACGGRSSSLPWPTW